MQVPSTRGPQHHGCDRRARWCRPQQFIAFSFDLADLAQHQLEPVDLAKNPRLEVSWDRASVSGLQFFQTFPAVLVQRIVAMLE